MNDIVPVSAVSIGDEILFSYNLGSIDYNDFQHYQGHIIAIYHEEGSKCVAWKDRKQISVATPITSYSRLNWIHATCSVIDDISEYTYFVWLPGNCLVKMVHTKILFPDQKCSGCNLPAPHIAPNAGNGFVCESCKFIATL